MKLSQMNARMRDEKLKGGMKSSVLRTRQIKDKRKPNSSCRQAPITIVIVGNHELGGETKLIEGEMKTYT